ncbi:DUF2958 domain-containing protein [Variovorax saccharolyticus]|uniref:DUF2958 domain-containing protein n=1 Tax=Variovorax saccharolyticus TaxID=3053516 RepID=UPI002578AE25|nr:DUF2958 domain-containing protein [Variovorax sp. J31P216]MDM0030382.1 DUF2958 domain-containing protein [Variovorax sp. J31P216]
MSSHYPFLTDPQVDLLLANGRQARLAQAQDACFDPLPVVKLFTPDAGATWLLTEIDPDMPGIAFGLCDLGMGCPELGSVSLAELAALRGFMQRPIAQDPSFRATQRLSAYASLAWKAGRIQA